MNDFKSYKPDDNQNKNIPADNENKINSTVELAKAVTRAMNGKSEGQLLHTIISEAERGKREGRLTNADLDNFYNMVAPTVDGFKRKKLKEVISKLKEI